MFGSVASPQALVSESERFATGRAVAPMSDSALSERGVRPFGLSFARPLDRTDRVALPEWRWSDDRQIGVTPNGESWHQTVQAGIMKTTGPSPDGGPNTGGEEWTPDFMPDQPS